MKTVKEIWNNDLKKIRLLICAPASHLEGGISAVVAGLEVGFRNNKEIEYKRIPYAKNRVGQKLISRIISEIAQLYNYIFVLQSFKPDIIIIETSFDKKTVFRDLIHQFFTRIFNIAFIIHAHGGEWDMIPKWNIFWRLTAEKLLIYSNCIVVTSKDEYDIIKTLYSEKVKVEKIFNPLLFPYFETPVKKNDKLTAIFASRLIESKGILDLIEAVGKIEFKNFTINIFGNGPLKYKAISRVKELGINDIIFFCGQIPLPELIKEYNRSDVFLFPSYHTEGFPMALFFAVASGMSIIATKVRPLPEYLVEPSNCLWINPKDPESLKQQFVKLLKSKDLRIIQSENNKKIGLIFTPDIVADRFVSLFKKIL